MARSRSYQKSRKLGSSDDFTKRPIQPLAATVATFDPNFSESEDEDESTPTFPVGKRLAFYLSARPLPELHQDHFFGYGDDGWMRERSMVYDFNPGPRYAYA